MKLQDVEYFKMSGQNLCFSLNVSRVSHVKRSDVKLKGLYENVFVIWLPGKITRNIVHPHYDSAVICWLDMIVSVELKADISYVMLTS